MDENYINIITADENTPDYVPASQFYELFDILISSMTSPERFDRSELVSCLQKICALYHVSKGVTEFYTNTSNEDHKNGEILCDYDNGKGGPAIIERRFISKTRAVIKGTIYRPLDEPPLSTNDIHRIDLAMRSILSFVSRNRLSAVVETFGFHDEHGFKNMRSFTRHCEILNNRKLLNGHFTACQFNLRHFTLINQDIGRKNGDTVIRNYYDMLSAAVGQDGIVCRMGGDNFVSIFRNEYMSQVSEILRGVPIYYNKEEEKRVMLSASSGLYSLSEDFVMHSISDIMDKIISAAQAARHFEDDFIVFYNEKMILQRDKMFRIQRLFPDALRNREFKVYYQPKVNVLTGYVVGAEALCRWFHDDKMIPPGDFIPIMEQSTDVCKLDFYMLNAVCENIRRWLDEGREPVRVSVNFSRKHLVDIDLLNHIIDIIDANDVPHKYIEIELTETTTDVEFRDLKRTVSGLQQAGIYTSVDDFGMGYSSLNLIREIPWNVLKIDRCFLPSDEEDSSSITNLMYKHVVSMALDLGLECVTEGVETSKQISILRNNHCNIAQGFIFNRPLPIEQFEMLLDNHRYEIDKYI